MSKKLPICGQGEFEGYELRPMFCRKSVGGVEFSQFARQYEIMLNGKRLGYVGVNPGEGINVIEPDCPSELVDMLGRFAATTIGSNPMRARQVPLMAPEADASPLILPDDDYE